MALTSSSHILKLKNEHKFLRIEPIVRELYNQFVAGNFTVKRSSVPYTSVGTDQGLEQTINRSQKSTLGIIGATQKKEYNLTYHELLAVKNLFTEITHVASENDELPKHYDFNPSMTSKTEQQLDKIISYITSHSNSLKIGSKPLKNIITQELATPECTKGLLNIFENGCKLYQEFFSERFVVKSKNLCDTIYKVKLTTFKSSQQENTLLPKSLSIAKQNQMSQRIIDIAKELGYSLESLFSFELTEKNPLFNEDGSMKKEKSKSDLVTELETLSKDHNESCNIKWKNIKTFVDFATAFCNSVKTVSKDKVHRIDFIFDSYFENSIKLDKRIVRYTEAAIEMHDINENVPMPKQEKQFWASKSNKVRKIVLDQSHDLWPNTIIICSATNEAPCESNLETDLETFTLLQRFDIEEADSRIIVHIHQACTEEVTEIFVLSSDTDKSMNLQKLWVQVGAGIYKLAEDCGMKLCSVLPALHHLTDADYTSKVGTKHSALGSEPEKYLEIFAHGISEADIAASIQNAEQFLLKVLKKTAKYS
ncbi:hypothetical protein TSAR_009479 [Trichomalopsis sarcophagae]|uniref:Uncharacterized protein n=1 Tax=Trichomalopsis sarcophagae TaxID=543379 RepID=A0A232FH43_9HYME|nr:hypothetical protein TSAR_009479 [Trichomalopsis sarcophagae]